MRVGCFLVVVLGCSHYAEGNGQFSRSISSDALIEVVRLKNYYRQGAPSSRSLLIEQRAINVAAS